MQGIIFFAKLKYYLSYVTIDSMRVLRKKRSRIITFWLPALLRKTSLFFFVIVLYLFFIYILGSFQKFTDSTQIFLLATLNIVMILSAFSSLFSMLTYIYIIPYRKKNVLFKIILSVVIFTFTIIFYIFINFLLVWF